MIVFPAHCNFFPETSSRGEMLPHHASLRLRLTLNRLAAHVNVVFVCITAIINARWVPMSTKSGILTYGGSTVCLHMPDKCMKCDLVCMQETSCGDVILTLVKSNSRLKVTCKEKKYPLNWSTEKPVGITKNTTTTPNLNSQKIFTSASFLGLLAQNMVALNFVSLQPKNN